MRSVELFSGCGGLALGLSRAGFDHLAMVERDQDACGTIRHNAVRGVEHVSHWPIRTDDVRTIDWTKVARTIDLVAGGPPCQPFSVGGKHAGPGDERDMWPEAIRAVRELSPKAFLFENVRGLLRPAFADYLRWIRHHLAAPHITRRRGESVADHLVRLERRAAEAAYDVVVMPVNAADYGAPQKRHRVIIAGVRRDLGIDLDLPRPTHARDRLLWDQWVTGDYWRRHGIRAPGKNPTSEADLRVVERLRQQLIAPTEKPWVTCRDAFVGLPSPGAAGSPANHVMQPGAKVYPGHTGSPIDEPAKALKAGDHGVPGGENMLVSSSGRVRYFTIREAARLQGLPDEYEFTCSWTESMRQLGNAVPVQLSSAFGSAMNRMILGGRTTRRRAA